MSNLSDSSFQQYLTQVVEVQLSYPRFFFVVFFKLSNPNDSSFLKCLNQVTQVTLNIQPQISKIEQLKHAIIPNMSNTNESNFLKCLTQLIQVA